MFSKSAFILSICFFSCVAFAFAFSIVYLNHAFKLSANWTYSSIALKETNGKLFFGNVLTFNARHNIAPEKGSRVPCYHHCCQSWSRYHTWILQMRFTLQSMPIVPFPTKIILLHFDLLNLNVAFIIYCELMDRVLSWHIPHLQSSSHWVDKDFIPTSLPHVSLSCRGM